MNQATETKYVIDEQSIEVRGYEVAKRGMFGGWEQVGHYKATERGRLETTQSAEWLQARHEERVIKRAKEFAAKLARDHALALAKHELGGEDTTPPAEPPTEEQLVDEAMVSAKGYYTARTIISFDTKAVVEEPVLRLDADTNELVVPVGAVE